jgi:hypothetical protein
MGGFGYRLEGRVDEGALRPRPVPRTVVDKLLGRTRTRQPSELSFAGARLVEVPGIELAHLKTELQAWLLEALPEPWLATDVVVNDYLGLDVERFVLRGGAKIGMPLVFGIDFTFAGCAGRADVSAAVASHWLKRWLDAELDRIEELHLAPIGFHATRPLRDDDTKGFVPLARGGYGAIVDDDGARHVECDGALFEHETNVDEALAALSDALLPTLPSGTCLCQLCAPTFDPSTLPDTPLTRRR